MTGPGVIEGGSLVFRIGAALFSQLDAWMRSVDEKVGREQVRTGRFFDGSPLDEGVLQAMNDSLGCGETRPLMA